MNRYFETIETIEMIAATVVHEVKNPLSLIQANIDFLEVEDLTATHRKNYDVIRREIKKANELLLDFIKLIKNTYRFDEDIEMYDIIMEVVESYNMSITKRISFDVNCPDKNIYFIGNRQLFTWLLSNIVKNSIEAIEDKGFIHISSYEKCGSVVVLVKDSGSGISQETMDKINGEEKYTSKENGSGIGIDICKNIISEHNGTYEIIREEGQGCLVKITVPVESNIK